MAVARIYPTSVVSTLGFNQTNTHNSVVVAPTDKSTVSYSMVNPNAGTTYWVGGALNQHQASEWRNNNLNVDVYFKYYTAPGGFNPGGNPVDYWTEIAWSQCYLDIDYTTGPVSSDGSLLFIGENF